MFRQSARSASVTACGDRRAIAGDHRTYGAQPGETMSDPPSPRVRRRAPVHAGHATAGRVAADAVPAVPATPAAGYDRAGPADSDRGRLPAAVVRRLRRPSSGYGARRPATAADPRAGTTRAAPRRSNAPLIAVILAVDAAALRRRGDRRRAGRRTSPTRPGGDRADHRPDAADPADRAPTCRPDCRPTCRTCRTDLPGLPGTGQKITVVVRGDRRRPGRDRVRREARRHAQAGRQRRAAVEGHRRRWRAPPLVSVIAVRSGVDAGAISCRATVDGEEVARAVALSGDLRHAPTAPKLRPRRDRAAPARP